MRTLVYMLRYRRPDLEDRCIHSIRECTPTDLYDLEVHDNFPINDSFSTLWNRAIAKMDKGGYTHFCPINSDVVVTPGWLEKLAEVFNIIPDAAAAGPVTDNCGSPQHGRRGPEEFRLVDVPELAGFLMLFPRMMFDKSMVGPFDEEYTFYGQETDWCERALQRGLRLIMRTDVWVHHDHGATIKGLGNYHWDERRKAVEIIERKRRERRGIHD